MKTFIPALAAATMCVAFATGASAAPVTVSQTVSLEQIGPFPSSFTNATFTSGAWSALFPFTQASQITGIRWDFGSTNSTWTDPANWPTNPDGVPGVELGVNDDSAVRTALVSFVPSGLTYDMGPGAAFDLVQGLVADGAIQASLGAYFNFAATASSTGITLGPVSTLTLTLTGDVPTRPVPEPGSLALLGLAALTGMGVIRRRA